MNNKIKLIIPIIIFLIIGGIVLTNINKRKKEKIVDLNDGKVLLTEEAEEYLRSEILSDNELKYTYIEKILRGANNRILGGILAEVDGVSKFTGCDVRTVDKKDEYNLRVYGNLYGEDDYKNKITKQYYANFYLIKDETNETIGRVVYDGFSINTN